MQPPPQNQPSAAPDQSFQAGSLLVEAWSCGPLATNAILLSDAAERQVLLIDPAIQGDAVLARAQQLQGEGYDLVAIWNTHGHFDHVYDNARWKALFPVLLWLHEDDAFFLEHLREQSLWFGLPAPETIAHDRDWKNTERTEFAGHEVRVLHTPGHSPGSVSFLFPAQNLLVCGDVLFKGSAGRVDLPGSEEAALRRSLQVLAALPDTTLVVPGHGEATTIGAEKASNPFLQAALAR